MTNLPTTPGGWKCVVADPPWAFSSNSKAKPGRNAMRHYDVMSLDDIAAMPVKQIVADDAVLAMWITSPLLVLGAHIPIFRAWGFKPTAMGWTWAKLNKRAPGLFHTAGDFFMGAGYTTRKNCEFVILGKRGKPGRKSASVRELIVAHVGRHSEKPDEFYRRVEAYADGPRLELFSRRSRPGWTTWGNEAGKFDDERQEEWTSTEAATPLISTAASAPPSTV